MSGLTVLEQAEAELNSRLSKVCAEVIKIQAEQASLRKALEELRRLIYLQKNGLKIIR